MKISSVSAPVNNDPATTQPGRTPSNAATSKSFLLTLDDLLKQKEGLQKEIDTLGAGPTDDQNKHAKMKELLDQLKQVEDQIKNIRGNNEHTRTAGRKDASKLTKDGSVDIIV